MKLSVTRVDIEKTRQHWPTEKPFAPAHIFPRADKDNWLVLSKPIETDAPPKWYQTAADEFIRIPLFPYFLSPEADLAFAFMLQLGLSCASHFPGAVNALHVVTGVPVEMAYNHDNDSTQLKHLEYWVGFGVLIQGK